MGKNLLKHPGSDSRFLAFAAGCKVIFLMEASSIFWIKTAESRSKKILVGYK